MRAISDGGPSIAGPATDVLAVGEVLICLDGGIGRMSTARSLAKSVGGAEANVCIGLARLGLRTAMVTKVGTDPFGDEIVTVLRGEGVDVARVGRHAELPTGLMAKERLDPERVNVYYYRAGSAATALDASDVAGATARHVHLTGITLAIGPGPARAATALARAARDAGATVSFDPNHRSRLGDLATAVAAWRAVLPFVTDLLCSADEARALTGAATVNDAVEQIRVEQLRTGRPERVVVRDGAQGAIGIAGGVAGAEPAVPTAVVDSVGAGDAHTAGYLFEILNGAPLAQALATASWCGAQVVGQQGDYSGAPLRREYDAWRAGAAGVRR